MQIESWDDIRVALAVARTGTVSGAASALGVHHATVIRRSDALEAALRARLFQRHPRGYALTEAGRTLLATAAAADHKLEWLREAAGERFGGIELARELYAVKLTDDRGAAERVLTQHFQLPEAEARRSPHGLSGSLDALCDTLEGRRERWGTSYWIVPPAAMDEMAALVERMTGA